MSYLSFIPAKLLLLLAISPLHGVQKNTATQNDVPAITKISYSSSGGRGGNTVSLDITANALVYVQGHSGSEKTIREKTSRSLWNSLVKAINTKDIDRVKSNPGHALYDGVDVTITVDKGKQIHSIVNGSEDALNYGRIKTFTDILQNQLSRLEKKIRW